MLTIYLKPVLPALAAQVEAFLQLRAAALGRRGAPHAAATRIGDYKHLMQRVDAKQLDALFEPPAAPDAAAPSLPGGEAVAADDRHRRLREDRPAHREDRRLPSRSRARTKLLRLTLDVGEGRTRNVFSGIAVGLQARAAGRQAHGAGRQPGAAQDEVRRQRRHGAGRQPRRREGASGAPRARALAGRGAGHARALSRAAEPRPAARHRAASRRSGILLAARSCRSPLRRRPVHTERFSDRAASAGPA